MLTSTLLKKTTWLFLAIVVFFTPLICIQGLSDYANLPQAAFLQVGCCIVLFFWMLHSFFQTEQNFIWSFADYLVLSWVAWASCSILWAPSNYAGIYIWSQWLAGVGLYLIARQLINTHGVLKNFLLLFFVSGITVAVIGNIQFLLPQLIIWIPQSSSHASTFANKNMAIEYILLTLPLGWIFFLLEKRALKEWIYSFGITTMAIYLSYALSRSGILFSLFQAAVLLIFLIQKKWRSVLLPDGWDRQKTAMVLVSLVLFFVFANLTKNGFRGRWQAVEARIEQASQELSPDTHKEPTGGRIVLLKNTWEMIKDAPWLGRGLNAFQVYYPLYSNSAVPDPFFQITEQPAQVHNDYVQAWAEQGIVGLLLMMGLFVSFMGVAWRGVKQRNISSPYHIAMLLAGIGIMLDAMVSFPMTKVIPVFVVLFYLSLMIGASPRKKTLVIPRSLYKILIPIFGVLLGLVIVWNYQRLAADKHYKNALNMGEKKNWSEGLSEAKLAQELNPGNDRIVFLLARFYIFNNQYEQAIAAFEDGLKRNPYSVNDIWSLGSVYLRMGNLAQALTHYQKASSLMPSVASFHFHIANIHKKLGNEKEAMAEYHKAFELDPSLF